MADDKENVAPALTRRRALAATTAKAAAAPAARNAREEPEDDDGVPDLTLKKPLAVRVCGLTTVFLLAKSRLIFTNRGCRTVARLRAGARCQRRAVPAEQQ